MSVASRPSPGFLSVSIESMPSLSAFHRNSLTKIESPEGRTRGFFFERNPFELARPKENVR